MRSLLNNLKSLNLTRQTLLTFLVVAIGSNAIYVFSSVNSVLYNPVREALGLTDTQLGVMLSVQGTIAFLAYLPGGWFCNRFRTRTLLAANLAITGLCGGYIALAPSYNSLLFIWAVMGLCAEGLYWTAVLKSVSSLTDKDHQGTVFGLLETVRGFTSMVVLASAIYIYSLYNSSAGIQAVYSTFAIILIVISIITYFVVPDDEAAPEVETGDKNKAALKNLIKVAKMPDLWLIGAQAMSVYLIYIVGYLYFVPFMEGIFLMTAVQVAVFGMFNQSASRMTMGPVAGILADSVFKSPTKLLRILFVAHCIIFGLLLVLPVSDSTKMITLVLLIAATMVTYMARGIYFAPAGELGLPAEESGGAMAILSVLAFSPTFWAYAFFGYLIGNHEAAVAYNYLFSIALGFAVLGIISSTCLIVRAKKRERLGLEENEASGAEVVA